MSEEILESYFGINPVQTIKDGNIIRYLSEDSLYTTVQVTHWEQEGLIELYEMSEHMAKNGDQKVSTFVAGNNQKFLITHDDQDYVLLHNHYWPLSRNKNSGRRLARFHLRGAYLQSTISKLNHYGQWKSYWIQRLEQMEKVWRGLVREPGSEKFEKMFIDSFPYFLGLCENAIQYFTDTALDEEPGPMDHGTITHHRFTETTWSGEWQIRSPFDWIYDHHARDIAEWIRNCYFNNPRTFKPELQKFIQEYQSVFPLSRFSWRLIYARLLFPLHYFLCVEDYFLTHSQWSQLQLEERLSRLIRDTRDYELFLGHFFHLASGNLGEIPEVEWLSY